MTSRLRFARRRALERAPFLLFVCQGHEIAQFIYARLLLTQAQIPDGFTDAAFAEIKCPNRAHGGHITKKRGWMARWESGEGFFWRGK